MRLVKYTFFTFLLMLLFTQISWADVGYTVRAGETIAQIAAKFHVNESDLIKVNNLYEGEELEEGIKLIIPYFNNENTDGNSDNDSSGDEVEESDEIAFTEYKVQPSDCLAKIARSFDCSVEDIAQLNSIDKNSVLSIGQILLIPNGEIISKNEILIEEEEEEEELDDENDENDENQLQEEDPDKGNDSNENTFRFKKDVHVKVSIDDIEGKNLLDPNSIEDSEIQILKHTSESDDNPSLDECKPKDEPAKISVIKQDVLLPDKSNIIDESYKGFIEHKVKKGDNVSKLAIKYDVSEDAIFKINKIGRHTTIDIDDILIIPFNSGKKSNPEIEEKPKVPKKENKLIVRNLAKRDKLVRKALEFEGLKRETKYGDSLTNGVDCSGFTMRIYEKFGVKLPRSAWKQALMGMEVKREDLIPADLVFCSSNKKSRKIGHVGIYIGHGYILHVSANEGRVIKAKLSSNYFTNNFITARRYF